MKKQDTIQKTAKMICIVLLFVFFCMPQSVQAASPAIRSIDITVDLSPDGDAYVTEIWDVTTESGTEFYITKHYLDEQEISELSVTDESGRVYENIGEWDSDRPSSEKDGQCGLLEINEGYEICWGIGSNYGDHVYTVRYKITNMVKGYNGGDAVTQWFVSKDLMAAPQYVRVAIRAEGLQFTQENTGVWGFGHTGEIHVVDGEVVSESTQSLRRLDYVAIMVEFDKEMFSPRVERSRTINDVRDEGMEGSDYSADDGEIFRFLAFGFGGADFIGPIAGVFFVVFLIFLPNRKKKGAAQQGSSTFVTYSKKRQKEVPYCREIPFSGDLPLTFQALKKTSGLPPVREDGNIIGAYLLRWIRSKQIEIVQQEREKFLGRGSPSVTVALKLYTPRPNMPAIEKRLYDMLISASGPDWLLQDKEFEKWSKKKYSTVESWFNGVKKEAEAGFRQIGAMVLEPRKVFFGLVTQQVSVPTPAGQQMMQNMYGFRKYLEDFTIINEREAREVQLWDEYLVFAQLFGIADKVAEQFNALYPDYFINMANDLGGLSTYDTMVALHISRSFARAGYSGYRAGYTAAHTSSYSGGGGGFSGGGGGGFSGGGSSGGGTR